MLRGGMTENNLVVRMLAKDSPRLFCGEMIMIQENWFVTPIWCEHLNIDTSAAANECLQLRKKKYPSRVISNIGGWQSVDIDLTRYEELSKIHQIIETKLNEVNQSIHLDFTSKLINVWININEKGNFNSQHVHPNSTFSGTIYLQVDDVSGKIVFENDTGMRYFNVKNPIGCTLFPKKISYSPRNGTILIFPAWALHEVEPSNSNKPRISISFNIRQC
jgi:uncharacterized protein (TIGR02466 family)